MGGSDVTWLFERAKATGAVLALVAAPAGCSLLEPFDGYTGGDQADSGPTGEGGLLFRDSSTAHPDSGPHPESGTGTGPDSASAMTCPDNTPYDTLPWAPPTKLGQPACTAGEISTYLNEMSSGDTGCDACIQTNASAAAWGPIVILGMSGGTTYYIINYGGCIADVDGQTQQGSCGDFFNNDTSCLNQECGDCSGSAEQTCAEEVSSGAGVCAGYVLTMQCATETQGSGEYATCLEGPLSMLTLWCGATVDAGPPPSEAGPVEAGAGD
jgi:hypothetical protein